MSVGFDRDFISEIKGKSCSVLGLGVSNLPLVELLLGNASSVTVHDRQDASELGERTTWLKSQGVVFSKSFEEFSGDIIFRSPGIRPDIDGIKKALLRGARLSSEMEMFLAHTEANTFGITGSDGKTTSTTLCGKFLEANEKGRTYVGGNIGTPLLDKCAEMTDEDNAVLELSSFQLMRVSRAPMYCAITNLSQNHLNWHIDMNEYAEAKYNIVGENTKRVVLNADCKYTRDFGEKLLTESDKEVIFFSSSLSEDEEVKAITDNGAKLLFVKEGIIRIADGDCERELLDCSDIRLPGKHNIENYMTAIGLTYGCVDVSVYSKVAMEFNGVEHRLELVRTIDEVDFYNSSIDSSPTRTGAALSALLGRDIVIICGGYDKNLDYEPLAKSICESVRTVVLTGASAPKIKAAILSYGGYSPEVLKIIDSESFEDAVALAANEAKKGGCVLLSPASASFDRFKNFAQRGEYFKELVKKL